MNKVDIHVGKKLKNKRLERNISIAEMAEIIHISQADYICFENGSCRVGSAQLYDISKILHISVGYFFEGIMAE